MGGSEDLMLDVERFKDVLSQWFRGSEVIHVLEKCSY